jgi:hypothetical protein
MITRRHFFNMFAALAGLSLFKPRKKIPEAGVCGWTSIHNGKVVGEGLLTRSGYKSFESCWDRYDRLLAEEARAWQKVEELRHLTKRGE